MDQLEERLLVEQVMRRMEIMELIEVMRLVCKRWCALVRESPFLWVYVEERREGREGRGWNKEEKGK